MQHFSNLDPLPIGVTLKNVPHTTVRRNEHLANVFHNLKLMEREGYTLFCGFHFVVQSAICNLQSATDTTIKRIKPYRLAALVLENLEC